MGLPGSGKSFFAERLASAIGATYFSSDRERIRLGGRGKYTSGDKLLVYEELTRLAKEQLNQGSSVVVDATFYLQKARDLFARLGEQQGVSTHYFYITASEEVIRERLLQARAESEADYSVYRKIKKEFEPLTMEVIELESQRDNIEVLMERAIKCLRNGEK